MATTAEIQVRDDKVLKGSDGRGKWHMKRDLKENEHGLVIVLLQRAIEWKEYKVTVCYWLEHWEVISL